MSPRRGPGEGSITLRKDGRWQVRVDLGRDALGRRQRKAEYAETQAEAVRLLKKLQREKDRGQLIASRRDAPRTVSAWLFQWLETVKRTKEPSTYAHYETDVRVHLVPALGRIHLERLTSSDVERFLHAKLAAGAAPASVERMRAVLSSALSKAVKNEILGRNVAMSALVELPEPDPQRAQQPMTMGQAKTFIASARTDRLYALWLTAVVMGQRESEMLGLRWSDIDFEGGRIHIVWKLVRVEGAWQLRRPKAMGSRQTLPLLSPVAAALREHQIRQEWERQVAGSDWWQMEHAGQPVDLLFTTKLGRPLYSSEVRRLFHRQLRVAKLPQIRFHDLRHSAASIMLALKVPLKTVSTVLGHSSIKMTADTYGHLADDVVREQLADVDRAWSEQADAQKEVR